MAKNQGGKELRTTNFHVVPYSLLYQENAKRIAPDKQIRDSFFFRKYFIIFWIAFFIFLS